MKHLIPEFEKMRARYPRGFESSLVLPCLRRIQEDRGFVADEDIDGVVAYLGVPRIQVEEVLIFYGSFGASRSALPPAGLPQPVVLADRRREGSSTTLTQTLGIAPGETTADGRFTLVDRRVPRRMRDGAGADGRRHVSREHDAGQGRRAAEGGA
jgi:NADH-quinone oxidoreductase subunit E